MKSYDPKEYKAFQAGLASHFAILTDVSARYTAKLGASDREWFFEQALELAWESRSRFHPCKKSIGLWWEGLCKQVALMRPTWTVLTITGEKIVPGKHLRLWGLNCNGDWTDTI